MLSWSKDDSLSGFGQCRAQTQLTAPFWPAGSRGQSCCSVGALASVKYRKVFPTIIYHSKANITDVIGLLYYKVTACKNFSGWNWLSLSFVFCPSFLFAI